MAKESSRIGKGEKRRKRRGEVKWTEETCRDETGEVKKEGRKSWREGKIRKGLEEGELVYGTMKGKGEQEGKLSGLWRLGETRKVEEQSEGNTGKKRGKVWRKEGGGTYRKRSEEERKVMCYMKA